MDMDFILNGSATGSSASMLLATNGHTGALRPWKGNDGRSYISIPDGVDADGKPKDKAIVTNAGALLRKNEWERIDDMVVKAARPRLKLINNMRSAGLTLNIANAFGTAVLQYERQSDISAARIGMDVTPSGDNDRPSYDIVNLPLPIISKEITMNSRAIAISRNGNTPLDVSNLELAAIKVAEQAEQLALGTLATYTYGGGTVYGLTNFPSRTTGTFLNPNVSGWTPTMLYNSVIDMIDQSTQNYHYGPWDLYYSTGLLKYMMQQFSIYDSTALEAAIRKLPGMASVQMLDYLTGNQLLLVERSSSVARIVMGMDITTVQWQENGGATEKFRVMAMMVPQLKVDQDGNCGVTHYSGNATTVAP